MQQEWNWFVGEFCKVDVACWAKGAWPVKAQAFGGRCYPEAGNLFDHYTVEYRRAWPSESAAAEDMFI